MESLDFYLQELINVKFCTEKETNIFSNELYAKASVGEYEINIIRNISTNNITIQSELNRKAIEVYDSEKLFELAKQINLDIPVMIKFRDGKVKSYTFQRFISKETIKRDFDDETLKTLLLVTFIGELKSLNINSFKEELKSFFLYVIQSVNTDDINKIVENIKSKRGAIPFGA